MRVHVCVSVCVVVFDTHPAAAREARAVGVVVVAAHERRDSAAGWPFLFLMSPEYFWSFSLRLCVSVLGLASGALLYRVYLPPSAPLSSPVHPQTNDLPVGRSVDEVLRIIQAFQFVEKHGEVCPAGWKPGSATMKADPAGSKVRRRAAAEASVACASQRLSRSTPRANTSPQLPLPYRPCPSPNAGVLREGQRRCGRPLSSQLLHAALGPPADSESGQPGGQPTGRACELKLLQTIPITVRLQLIDCWKRFVES